MCSAWCGSARFYVKWQDAVNITIHLCFFAISNHLSSNRLSYEGKNAFLDRIHILQNYLFKNITFLITDDEMIISLDTTLQHVSKHFILVAIRVRLLPKQR